MTPIAPPGSHLDPVADDLPGPLACAVVAFCAGAGVLALEVTGARVLTPWFGSSIVVWSNVIGVTLFAIALGNFFGGRIADRLPHRSILAGVLVGAGVLAAMFPWLVPILARRYLPDDLPLDIAFAMLGKASLVVALSALAPPLVLIGAVSPFLVRSLAAARGVGGAAGWVSGLGTLGSLLGTWAPVYWLIPSVGSKITCLLAGALLTIAGAIAAWRGRRTTWLAILIVALGTSLVALRADRSPNRGAVDGSILAEIESRYQYARVEQNASRTALKLNEGLDSFHSLTIDGELLTGAYYDPYLLLPPLVAKRGETFDVAILGFAAGTSGRQFLTAYSDRKDLRIVGVELDPAVAALGTKYFSLPNDERLSIVVDQDARVFLDHDARKYEAILVDTYAHQVYVPFQTCSKEFFAAARERLEPGGILAANIGGIDFDDVPLSAIRNTAAAVFDRVALERVSGSRNFILLAARDASPPSLASALDRVPSALAGVVERCQGFGQRREFAFDPSLVVLTDDRSAIERLADSDLLARARRELAAALRAGEER